MRVPMRSRITLPVFALLTLVLSLVFTPSGSAEEPGLLYGTAVGGTQLVAFNLNAGSVRVIGNTGFPGSAALAFCRPGGRPYTITNMGSASEQLATLDLSTGAATLVGPPLGQSLGIMALTCSPDGTLYAVGQLNTADPDFNSLYTVDRETGLASLIGATSVANGFLMALDFAPDGTLYGANAKSLFRIDPSTGHADKVVDFNGVTTVAGVKRVMGLAIAKDGDFFISDYWPVPPASTVYALDITTGTATPILNTGLATVHAIAFKAPGR
jgi:hypothetical protein